MFEPLLHRTVIAGSPLARRLTAIAAAQCLLTALLLALAAVQSSVRAWGDGLLPALCAGAAFAVAVGLSRRGAAAGPGRDRSLAADADGRLVGWSGVDAAPAALRVRAISPWLIVLVPDEGTAASGWTVWRDSLPPAAFRRLSALARWQLQRTRPPVAAEV